METPTSPRSLTVSSASRSHSGCVSHQGILLTPIPFVPWQSGLPSPRYNLTLKVKNQGQRYPSQHSIQFTHFLSVSHQVSLSTPIPFIQWQSGLPFLRCNLTLKVKGEGQRYPSQRSVQLTRFLSILHHGILSTPVNLVPWQLGLPFLRWLWKFKVKGQDQRYTSQCSIQLTHFRFVLHQLDMANRMFDWGKTHLKFCKKIYKIFFFQISP